jgi:hypothetical protein
VKVREGRGQDHNTEEEEEKELWQQVKQKKDCIEIRMEIGLKPNMPKACEKEHHKGKNQIQSGYC